MTKYINHTLKEYSKVLSQRKPTPGGGSAAALTGNLGVSLILMVARYSEGKGSSKRVENKFQKIIQQSERIQERLMELVDLDAQAYLAVVQSKGAPKRQRTKAFNQAKKVPLEVGRLCYKAVQLTPFLVEVGNQYLIADIEVAVELLLAAFNASMALTRDYTGS